MADTLKKTKTIIEWLEHGRTIAELGGGLGIGTGVKAILRTYTHLNPVWITPIWICAAAVAAWFLVFLSRRFIRPKEQVESQAIATPPESSLKNADEFYKTYDNALLAETEQLIRQESDKYKPGENREAYLIRILASGSIMYSFDVVWYTVWNSQLRLLDVLNAHSPLLLADAKKYYDQASQTYPVPYLTYSFDQWLNYLNVWFLVTQQGQNISITLRGREFLKYLVHNGRSFSDRNF